MVMAQSLFRVLKQRDPAVQVDVLAPSWSFPLLDRMPEVSNAIAMPLSHGQFGLTTRIRLGKTLRVTRYDQAIILPNSWKSALIPYFAKIPRRTGYLGELRWGLLNDARKLDQSRLTMTVQRFVALGLPDNAQLPPECPEPALTIRSKDQQAVMKKFALPTQERILALCPGAEFGPAKRWPAAHFAQLADNMAAWGWSVWLFGSDKDHDIAAQINRLCHGVCRDLSGQTTLAEAVDLMSLTSVVVVNDSGLMHVAAALDKPLIALYGSSDPGFTPPLNSKARIIDLKLSCSPCFARVCPLGHTNCLTGISPRQVQDAIE